MALMTYLRNSSRYLVLFSSSFQMSSTLDFKWKSEKSRERKHIPRNTIKSTSDCLVPSSERVFGVGAPFGLLPHLVEEAE
ncbi:hypothetical protein HUJ04_008015 [Dendroctonus ponderosae]|nr:hypothetical protein HUJ04_008015 [Dendroctonus ponderosae]KAH1026288.1 hypothetical protein HUJ05_010832 [Dendroctonus ponderosae]